MEKLKPQILSDLEATQKRRHKQEKPKPQAEEKRDVEELRPRPSSPAKTPPPRIISALQAVPAPFPPPFATPSHAHPEAKMILSPPTATRDNGNGSKDLMERLSKLRGDVQIRDPVLQIQPSPLSSSSHQSWDMLDELLEEDFDQPPDLLIGSKATQSNPPSSLFDDTNSSPLTVPDISRQTLPTVLSPTSEASTVPSVSSPKVIDGKNDKVAKEKSDEPSLLPIYLPMLSNESPSSENLETDFPSSTQQLSEPLPSLAPPLSPPSGVVEKNRSAEEICSSSLATFERMNAQFQAILFEMRMIVAPGPFGPFSF